MSLKLVPFTDEVWREVTSWDGPQGPMPGYAVCCEKYGNLLGAIVYLLPDDDTLVVDTVYMNPMLEDEARDKAHKYLCTGIKHLATMLGREAVSVVPFIAQKKGPPARATEDPQRQATKPVDSNVTPTSTDVKDDLVGW